MTRCRSAIERVAERAQALALLFVVLDDAVVHQREFAVADADARCLVGHAASVAQRVADAERRLKPRPARRFPFPPRARCGARGAPVGRDHGDAGRIVAAVFQTLQSPIRTGTTSRSAIAPTMPHMRGIPEARRLVYRPPVKRGRGCAAFQAPGFLVGRRQPRAWKRRLARDGELARRRVPADHRAGADEASALMVTGATSELLEPMKAPSPMVVVDLFTPS